MLVKGALGMCCIYCIYKYSLCMIHWHHTYSHGELLFITVLLNVKLKRMCSYQSPQEYNSPRFRQCDNIDEILGCFTPVPVTVCTPAFITMHKIYHFPIARFIGVLGIVKISDTRVLHWAIFAQKRCASHGCVHHFLRHIGNLMVQ